PGDDLASRRLGIEAPLARQNHVAAIEPPIERDRIEHELYAARHACAGEDAKTEPEASRGAVAWLGSWIARSLGEPPQSRVEQGHLGHGCSLLRAVDMRRALRARQRIVDVGERHDLDALEARRGSCGELDALD